MNAFLKLENLNKDTNFDNIRKQKLQQILNEPTKTTDHITFIDNFIKHYCSSILTQLKAVLSQDDYQKVLNNFIKFKKVTFHCKTFQILFQPMSFRRKAIKGFGLIFYYFRLLFLVQNHSLCQGKFLLEISEKQQNYEKGSSIVILEEGKQQIKLTCVDTGELLNIDRSIYKQMITNAQNHENTWKLKCLAKTFQKFKLADNKEILLSYFKSSGKLNFGQILTTPTSGSKDLFIAGFGKILVFAPNRYNQSYNKSFLILNIFKENNTFNESQLLYDHDEFYGTMVIEDQTELLQLSKQSMQQVTDQDTLDILRDSCSSKERLYKQMIDKLSLFPADSLEKQQIQLAQAFGLQFNKIEEKFNEHTKNGTIYTTEALTMKEKHLQDFNSKVGKTQLSYKGGGEVDADEKQKMIFGTNRIVARELKNVKGMTATQQLALINLQSIGKSRRSGQFDKDSPLKDLTQMEVQKYKNNMLDAVKEEEKQYSFEKKEIGSKKLHSLQNQNLQNEIKLKKSEDLDTLQIGQEKVIIINNDSKSLNEDQKPQVEKPKGNTASKARQKLLSNI